MTDLSRRNFLKGLMATAGVVAVGMPALAAVEAAVAPPLPFPDHDVGDVFMKVDDVWRFLGKSVSWTVHREREFSFINPSRGFNDHGNAIAGRLNIEAKADLALDVEGRKLLLDEFYEGRQTDFAISQGDHGLYTLKKSFIRDANSTMSSQKHRFDHVVLEISEIEVTFPTAEAA